MTLDQMYSLATSGAFQNRVRMAALNQAITVMAETGANPIYVETLRTNLASSTISDGCSNNLTRFVYGIASTPGFTSTPVDADIQFAMVTQWSTLAGVTFLNTQGQ